MGFIKFKEWGAKKIIIKSVIGLAIILALQITTYLTFAHKLLEYKLLGNWYKNVTHSVDSAYIRDFYVTDCSVGDESFYRSHHLSNKEQLIREKLGVKYVKFQDHETFSWDDREETQFKLSYHTWTQYHPKITPIVVQHEWMRIKDVRYNHEIAYMWVLFFWIEVSDVDYSDNATMAGL